MTTLMQGGFEASTLGKNNVTKIADYIENLFRKQHGLLGFGMV